MRHASVRAHWIPVAELHAPVQPPSLRDQTPAITQTPVVTQSPDDALEGE